VEAGVSEGKAKEAALSSEKVKKWLDGKKIQRIIFVPEKLINFIV
jgi:leucyl-tRNA synthetase